MANEIFFIISLLLMFLFLAIIFLIPLKTLPGGQCVAFHLSRRIPLKEHRVQQTLDHDQYSIIVPSSALALSLGFDPLFDQILDFFRKICVHLQNKFRTFSLICSLSINGTLLQIARRPGVSKYSKWIKKAFLIFVLRCLVPRFDRQLKETVRLVISFPERFR